MGEFPQPDPSATGGQTTGSLRDPDDQDGADTFGADVIAAAHEVVDPAEQIKAERAAEMGRNLEGIWQTADQMAQAAMPGSVLMYSGVTTDRKMTRSVDFYQAPSGHVQVFMARFRPGTTDRVVYPCTILSVRPSPEAPRDYIIEFVNPILFDKDGRPAKGVLDVATDLPRAIAANRPHDSLQKYRRRTSLHGIKTDLTPFGTDESSRHQDLELIEARDMQIALGAEPPYRAGALNIGDRTVGKKKT